MFHYQIKVDDTLAVAKDGVNLKKFKNESQKQFDYSVQKQVVGLKTSLLDREPLDNTKQR